MSNREPTEGRLEPNVHDQTNVSASLGFVEDLDLPLVSNYEEEVGHHEDLTHENNLDER